jgi:hypothetical protein
MLGILLGTATTAPAADMCFDTGLTLVLKSFSLPAKGKCKEYRGFYLVNTPPAPSLLSWLSGSACASTDDTHITFLHYGLAPKADVQYSDFFSLPRTTLTGELRECYGGSQPCLTVPIASTECNPAKVPIP